MDGSQPCLADGRCGGFGDDVGYLLPPRVPCYHRPHEANHEAIVGITVGARCHIHIKPHQQVGNHYHHGTPQPFDIEAREVGVGLLDHAVVGHRAADKIDEHRRAIDDRVDNQGKVERVVARGGIDGSEQRKTRHLQQHVAHLEAAGTQELDEIDLARHHAPHIDRHQQLVGEVARPA